MDNAPYVGSAANMTSGERRRQRYQMDFFRLCEFCEFVEFDELCEFNTFD